MTKHADNVVTLSVRDWTAIIGLVMTVSGGVLYAYLHHDRLLMQLVVQQQQINHRLDKIEEKMESRRE
jgi:uncharacterized membrane-anchored protein YhcB (DUF1043 family)